MAVVGSVPLGGVPLCCGPGRPSGPVAPARPLRFAGRTGDHPGLRLHRVCAGTGRTFANPVQKIVSWADEVIRLRQRSLTAGRHRSL